MESLKITIVDYLIKNDVIIKEDREIYEYGTEQILFNTINLIVILIIGLSFNALLEIVTFIIPYILLRGYAGGYHAETKLKCFVYSIMMIIIVVMTNKIFEFNELYYLVVLISSITIIKLGPVETDTKPLDDTEIKVYEKKMRNILFGELFVLSLVFTLQITVISLNVSLSIIVVSFMLLIGKRDNIIKKKAVGI